MEQGLGQRLVPRQAQRLKRTARIGNAEPFQQAGDIGLVAAIVPSAFEKIEDDFRPPDRKPVLIGDAPPQDEGCVVKCEVACVEKNDLANSRPTTFEALGREKIRRSGLD